MKAMCNALRYHAAVYLRTTKYVVPFVVLLIVLGGVYGLKPLAVVNSYAFAAGALFFATVLVGFTYGDVEDPVSEQLVILKMGSSVRHHTAKMLFVWLVSLLFGLMAALLPVVFHAVSRFTLFKRALTVPDVLYAMALDAAVAILGGTVGALFHPRVVKDRKLAMLLAAFVSVTGYVKIGFHRAFAPSKAVTWLLPPISDVVDLFFAKEVFIGQEVLLAVGMALLYSLVVAVMQIWLLERNGF